MRSLLLVTLAALAVLALVWFVRDDGGARAPLEQGAVAQESSPVAGELAVAPREDAAPAPAPAERAALEAVAPKPEPSRPAPSVERSVLRGRVVDAWDVGVAGVGVGLRGGAAEVVSGPGGAFRLERPGRLEPSLVNVLDERRALLFGYLEGGEAVLKTAPRVRVDGHVTTPDLEPVVGAAVQMSGFHTLLQATGEVHRDYWSHQPRATTDGAGAFRLDGVPAPPEGARLQVGVSAAGFAPAWLTLPPGGLPATRIELRPTGVRFLRGLVVDAGGPVAEAEVVFAGQRAHSTESGAFALALPGDWLDDASLVAYHATRGAASLAAYGATLTALGEGDPPPVRLELTAPLAIAGRVLDVDGAPLEDWRVDLLDGTEVEPGGYPRRTVELVHGGGVYPVTNADGAFRLTGLLEREYRLRAIDLRTLQTILSGPIRAGREGVELRLEPACALREVRGRLVDEAGAPLAGVSVLVQFTLLQDGNANYSQNGERARSDEQGAFTLARVPGARVRLEASGGEADSATLAIEDVPVDEELVWRLKTLCRLQLDARDTACTDCQFEVLDRAGEPLSLQWEIGGGRAGSTRPWLESDLGSTYEVRTDAALLRVLRGGQVVAEAPLRLVRGELNVVVVPR
ncbi:MAG: carboxypeptidase regulatory-like domain-containing protein [Planctomycetes bacterium]|nr:carboxypeptidase regulatory-like domain-containing protein [Planctomycetota bacterium]